MENQEKKACCACGCRYKADPRGEDTVRKLKNRLSRIQGQLGGLVRMLDENRYCGDILTQVAAIERALEAFGDQILREHLETCVAEELAKGNTEILDEACELIRKLK